MRRRSGSGVGGTAAVTRSPRPPTPSPPSAVQWLQPPFVWAGWHCGVLRGTKGAGGRGTGRLQAVAGAGAGAIGRCARLWAAG